MTTTESERLFLFFLRRACESGTETVLDAARTMVAAHPNEAAALIAEMFGRLNPPEGGARWLDGSQVQPWPKASRCSGDDQMWFAAHSGKGTPRFPYVAKSAADAAVSYFNDCEYMEGVAIISVRLGDPDEGHPVQQFRVKCRREIEVDEWEGLPDDAEDRR